MAFEIDIDINDPSFLSMTDLTVSIDYLQGYLKQSQGQSFMSAEDMKGMLVVLSRSLEKQTRLNNDLIERIKKLEKSMSKKPWYRFGK